MCRPGLPLSVVMRTRPVWFSILWLFSHPVPGRGVRRPEPLRHGAGVFSRGEINLLEEVASDISFALDKIEGESRRRQAEAALRESRDLHRSLVEASPDAISVTDTNGLLTFASPKALEIFGHPPDEDVTGRSVLDWVSYDQREMAAENLRYILNGEALKFREFTLIKKDGTTFAGEINGAAFNSNEGNPKGIVLITRDVTNRKRAEDELRGKRGTALRLFIEHAPAALAMFDRQMCYLSASRRWLSDYSLGEMDLTGMSHYEVFPQIPERWKEVHHRGLAGEVMSSDADRFVGADGSVQWQRWEVRPWHDSNGDVGGIVIFSEDITGSQTTGGGTLTGRSAVKGRLKKWNRWGPSRTATIIFSAGVRRKTSCPT